jgi:hypothetical protein
MATVTASTKRGTLVAGKRGEPVENIASLKCLPLDPLDAQIAQHMALDRPHELLQTAVRNGLDILPGDILVVSGTEYPVERVGEWYFGPESDNWLQIVVRTK